MTVNFGFIGIVTSDLAASLRFYRALGVEIPEGVEDQPHVDAVLPGGPAIAWDTIDTIHTFDPSWSAPSGSHRIALAFSFDQPEEVDAAYQTLVAEGHPGHVAPWDAFWGQRYASVLDPDGNSVDLFAALGD